MSLLDTLIILLYIHTYLLLSEHWHILQ